MHAGRGVLVAVLLCLGLARSAAAQPWPTLEFEIYEGHGRFFEYVEAVHVARLAGLHRSDVPLPLAPPLSPALKAEMEAYLSSVAAEYQRMGFPPPALEPIVTRADGREAYRVYWYAFGDVDRMKGSSDVPGVTSYACRGEVNPRRMNLNARTGSPTNRLARSTGRVPGMLDSLTDKGYGDLAHELFHAVQRGTRFFDANCEPPAWLNEGQAEAVGHDMAWQLKGIRSPDKQANRWGLRPYFQPFDTRPERRAEERLSQGYGTSSFWRYLAELERAMQSAASPPPRPGPGPVTQANAFDYGYLVRLLSNAPQLQDGQQTLDWLNGWLAADPRLGPLEFRRAFADFVTVLAEIGRHRVIGQLPLAARVDAVQSTILNGCDEVQVGMGQVGESAVTLLLPAISARCIRVRRTDSQPGSLVVDLRTETTVATARSLWMGVAGTTGATAASVHEAPQNAVASWQLTLQPSQVADVVIANVDAVPSRSSFAEPEFRISVPGWQWQGPPFNPAPARSRARPSPTPRGAAPTGQNSDPVTYGPGTVRLEREATVPDSRACRWPYADAAVHCGPVMELVLRRLPRWLAQRDVDPDRALVETAGLLEAFVASRSADALDALDDVEVRIRLPQLDYGFQGEIDHVLITVASGGTEAVSRGPRDVERGRLTYFPASGRLTVEQYDALVFTGRFQGDVVEAPLPNSHRENRPELPVIARVEGRFVVGQPWLHDDRWMLVVPEPASTAAEISDRIPGPLRVDPRFGSAGEQGQAAGDGSGTGTGTGACDCSCAEKARLERELEEMDDTDADMSANLDAMRKAMCLLSCQSAHAVCP